MANNSKALVRVDGSPAQRLATYRAFEQQVTKGETVTLHYVPLRDGAGGCFIHASLSAHDGSDRLRIMPADHLSATG